MNTAREQTNDAAREAFLKKVDAAIEPGADPRLAKEVMIELFGEKRLNELDDAVRAISSSLWRPVFDEMGKTARSVAEAGYVLGSVAFQFNEAMQAAMPSMLEDLISLAKSKKSAEFSSN